MAFDLINPAAMPADLILGDAMIPSGLANQPLAQETVAATQTPDGRVLPEPSVSDSLLMAGLALLQADQAGLGIGAGIALAGQNISNSRKQAREDARKERQEQLGEYELLGRIRERQLAELQASKKLEVTERLKQSNPDLADLIDLDPEKAAEVIAKQKTGGGESGPFAGTSMDAQTTNILLTGDPASAEYLAAYNIAAAPKVSIGPDGQPVTITPDMSAYRVPAAIQAKLGAMPAPAAGAPAGATSVMSVPAAANPAPAVQDPLLPSMGPAGGVKFGDPTRSVVPGFTILEGARPTDQDAKAVKEINSAMNSVVPLLKKRKELIEKADDLVAGSKDALEIDKNTNAILLKIKGLEQTGALDQGSIDVIRPMIGDPIIRGISLEQPLTDLRTSQTKAGGGIDFALSQLRDTESSLRDALLAAANARGYQPEGQYTSIFEEVADAPSGSFTKENPARPQTQADFDALEKGTPFINPADGTVRTKR